MASHEQRQNAIDDDLMKAAALQGRAWQRSGADIHAKLKRHAPHWPGDQRQRLHLVLASFLAAKEAVPRD